MFRMTCPSCVPSRCRPCSFLAGGRSCIWARSSTDLSRLTALSTAHRRSQQCIESLRSWQFCLHKTPVHMKPCLSLLIELVSRDALRTPTTAAPDATARYMYAALDSVDRLSSSVDRLSPHIRASSGIATYTLPRATTR